MAWLYFLLFFSNNKVKSGQIGFNWNLHRMLQKNRIHCLRLLTILDKKQHYTNILIRNFVKSKFDFNCCIRWKAIILKTFRQVFSKLCRESNSLRNLFWEYRIVASRSTSRLVTPPCYQLRLIQLVTWGVKNKSCPNELKFCNVIRV